MPLKDDKRKDQYRNIYGYFNKKNKKPLGLIAPPFIISFLATKKMPTVKLGQVVVSSNIAQNQSSSL